MNVVEITNALIAIPSETGSEKNLALWIEAYATDHGYSIERDYIDDNRWNVFLNWNEYADVVFTTHIDAVPPFIPPRITEERVIGRGACDTKGIIASMLVAGEEICTKGDRPAYLFVVGEEVDSCGAKQAARSAKRAGYIINGEPTGNVFVKGHKGVLGYSLHARGTSAHSAFPEKGNNAVHKLLDVLNIIRNEEWKSDEIFGAPTMNIGLIHGGIAPNVISDYAECTVLHRIVGDTGLYESRLSLIVPDDIELQYFAKSQPQKMYVPDGNDYDVVSFGTDIPYLRALGTPVLIGPGSIHDAHTDHESVKISELYEAVNIYKELYYSLREVTHG